MISFIIVGSGYRSEYYGRVAQSHPDLFRAIFLCRSEEKVQLVTAHTGIPATTDVDKALAINPNFVVVAVDREHVAVVAEEWVLKGFPVVTETPVGSSIEKLERLWELQETKGARIVCCEQYHRQPLLAGGLSAISSGLLGTPTTGYLSLVHDYHAASILRMMLMTGNEKYVLHGERKITPVTETDSRYGAFYDGRVGQETRDIVHIDYESGKTAVYDFASTEYRSYIRGRHITVRCEKGEWNDRLLYYLDENNNPQRQLLMSDIPEKYRMLDTQSLRDIRRTWQPELQLDTLQDEYAIATILYDMKDYIAGDKSPYPLRDALDDAVFWLLVQETAKNPWQEITVPKTSWNS
ncbi:MAG: Gfo/Idh/MocA family oxidoreductase [Butyrivibrio sp.]|nr:Gfo/Idh/MocA family oxidoreductase [Butyrivibrio sp.]MBQ8030180.1 Gfo/Idh/MocA family oxidoreductase [Butyrivibrio sp.]MBR1640959.1 Gfo/Idh/MocA family oxidoreductase [Butyrivibrio sp.]